MKGFRKILLSTPKNRGFKSLNKKPQIVQVGDLANIFVDGSKVNPKQLFKKQLIASETADVKILSLGEISVKIIVEGCKVSATAKEKIEKAGGSVV